VLVGRLGDFTVRFRFRRIKGMCSPKRRRYCSISLRRCSILLLLHFAIDLGGRRVIGLQSRSEVCVNAGIGFLQRNCQRESFLFRKVSEIFCQGISSRYEPRMPISFVRQLRTGRGWGNRRSQADCCSGSKRVRRIDDYLIGFSDPAQDF